MAHHRRGLRRLLRDDALLAEVEANPETASLDSRRRQMLRYATKLTLTPGQMTRADVDALREVGFADGDVLAIAEVVGYYAYANRIADGLGIDLEDSNRDDEAGS